MISMIQEFDLMLNDFGVPIVYNHFQSSILNPLTGVYSSVTQSFSIDAIMTNIHIKDLTIGINTQVINSKICWVRPLVNMQIAKGDTIVYASTNYVVKEFTRYLDIYKLLLEIII